MERSLIVKRLAAMIGPEHPGGRWRRQPAVQLLEAMSAILASEWHGRSDGSPGLGHGQITKLPGKCRIGHLMPVPLSGVLAGKARSRSGSITAKHHQRIASGAIDCHFAFRAIFP